MTLPLGNEMTLDTGVGAGPRLVAYWARPHLPAGARPATGGISSGGRAIGSQSIGQGFESPILQQYRSLIYYIEPFAETLERC